ncbi:hypothetical protein [uncultured Tenacibaculum sp.]|uniref:hypothetical protein n=1 Tax=uncultured Tenacibaculum sp. TaxID=174713 RepID=UPI00262ACED8|nr:hypothetical protein [uncultured Tenacibaculum sp.]
MASITIGANPVLTNLNTKVTYNPKNDYPAVTVIGKGKNNEGKNVYSAYAICYIPTGTLIPQTVAQFCESSYSGFTPTQAVPLVGSTESATVVLANFEDIAKADVENCSSGNNPTARSFAVCYDFKVAADTPYECNVYALQFDYTVNDDSNFEVLFLAQGDVDPELSRGTVTTPAIGKK